MADNLNLVSKNADSLSVPSRDFYERSIFKMFLSIVYFAVALLFLGLCSQAGGNSRQAYYLKQSYSWSTDYENGENAMLIGHGFASFFFFCAFAIAVGCSFHISPLTHGSVKERITIRTPIEVDKTI